MSTLPPNLSGGLPAPTNDDFNQLRKFAIENALTSGAPGMRRRAFGGGSLMTPIPQRVRRPITATESRTLLVTDSSTTSPAAAKIRVTVGAINNVIPTISGTAINVRSGTPALAPALTVTTGYVYLHATVDDGLDTVTALTIENASSVPADDATNAYKSLASLTVADDAITFLDATAWNLSELRRCGETTYYWGGFGA